MFFGATTFAAAPFAGVGIVNITVQPTGTQVNVAIGNTTIGLVTTVPVNGNQINLATNTVDVINWNPIIPGATGVWIPIDPNNP
jgi:hypothetical protein